MISHDNIVTLVRHFANDIIKLKIYGERLVSYLPLSHIAAQFIDIFTPLVIGATVYFAQPDALKGTLQSTLVEAKPTFFFGVPRVWEKMQEKITAIIEQQSGIKLTLFQWARKQATEHINSNFFGQNSKSNSYSIAKILVLNKVKNTLGLSECRNLFSGAAPTRKDTLDFFVSLGLPLCEVFGMSELTGPHIVGLPYSNRITSVGRVENFNKSKIHNPDADGCGELCIFGRHVFMGYLNNPEKTKETIDKDGEYNKINLLKIFCFNKKSINTLFFSNKFIGWLHTGGELFKVFLL